MKVVVRVAWDGRSLLLVPSSKRSRRQAAITNRQRKNLRASSREIGPEDRRAPVVPLPRELAEAAELDRAAVEARRANVRSALRQVEAKRRQARQDGDEETLRTLDEFARNLQSAVRPAGSLDRYSY